MSLLLLIQQGNAQTNPFAPPGTRSVHAYTDVYKTNFERPFRKLQAGLEVGYLVNSKLQFTAGMEFWNEDPTPMATIGNRYYPFGATFVRYRALVGRSADVALGFGHSFKIGEKFIIEAASDYYLDEREIGFRLGFGYRWRKAAQSTF
ncbi:hypothetical protein [Cesiribacter sp. SM1]|uniref:hypothetical protein n=1 Tax=Cesiribacter sp. SM1 TaxID=2861196 RepID=UPI001CD7DE87|nr:hypothetical protein [Cesiribacter sp. SM1]